MEPRFVRRHRRHHYGFRFAGHQDFFDEDREARECAIVRNELAHAHVLIDVGACHGIYSCLAAAMGRRVAAFEPELRNLCFLISNIRVNGFDNVEVFPVALSGAVGVRELFGHRDIASLTPRLVRRRAPGPGSGRSTSGPRTTSSARRSQARGPPRGGAAGPVMLRHPAT